MISTWYRCFLQNFHAAFSQIIELCALGIEDYMGNLLVIFGDKYAGVKGRGGELHADSSSYFQVLNYSTAPLY